MSVTNINLILASIMLQQWLETGTPMIHYKTVGGVMRAESVMSPMRQTELEDGSQ